jgi:hypothetical protein
MRKIIACSISAQPKSMFDPMPQVTVTFTEGTTKFLFEYYPDEIQFTPEEFIGLTEEEAHGLKTRKDIAYLQS